MLGRIAGYELLELVGTGGMSHVFQARDARLGSTVAVKVLFDSLARDPEYRERFFREARLMASLSHPSIAKCFHLEEAAVEPPDLIPPDTPGLPPAPSKLYLAMEFVHGSDLSALVTGEPIEIPRVLRLTEQIAAGLEAAHAAGVVHRDLKPANVRVTPDDHVKIVDFGLAAIMPSPNGETVSLSTSRDHVMGTWHFMSPEQTYGRTTDPRSDLFSLGSIVYLLVTGRLPFTGKTSGEVSDAIRHVEPPPMARYANGVPDELERIVRKLLAKDPANRYQSAHEVRTDLAKLSDRTIAPPVPSPFPGLHALLLPLGAMLVLVAGWFIWEYFFYRPWRTLAVVPLVNRTGDPRLDYLGDGIAADLIGPLVRGSRLNVAALSTMQPIDPSKRTAVNLARELGADATLAGSLSEQEEVLRLHLELAEGKHGFVLWTGTYDYDFDAGTDIERQIVRDVLHRLSKPFEPRRATAPRPTKPPVGSAYEGVLRATSALDDPDERGPDRALGYLAHALEQDPDFAPAWACRSQALWKLWNRDKEVGTLQLAVEAANRAVRLDPELLEARVARAQVYKSTSRYAEAIRDLKDVLKVNPNWDEAELQLAAVYREAGDLASAETHFRNTTVLRPGYFRNWSSLGILLMTRGNYAGAREAFSRVIQLVPEKNLGYALLGALEIKTGNYDAAIAQFERLPAPVQDATVATNIGTAYFFGHRPDDARHFYALAARLSPRDVQVWVNLADLDTKAGRADSALVHYGYALQAADDQLHVNPRNGKLRVQRILCLAKLHRCDEVHAALAAGADTLGAGNVDFTQRLAKVYALCGSRAKALAALKRAVELGASPAALRDEDEFAALKNDPAFPSSPAHKTP